MWIMYLFSLLRMILQNKWHQNNDKFSYGHSYWIDNSINNNFIKEIFDKRIKSETDVENELEIPVLGSIQKFN